MPTFHDSTSTRKMTPEPYVRAAPTTAQRGWIHRGFASVVRERRLPYRVRHALDQGCAAVGLRHKRVRVGGLRFKLRRLTTDELFVENIVVNAEYTPPGYDIRSGDTVIDIGGNIGVFAVLAARRAAPGRVFVFEPVTENFDLLRANIALNKLKNVTPIRAAVLDRRATDVKIYLNAKNTGAHSVFPSYGTNPDSWFETVGSLTLGDVIDEWKIDRVDFLKLDCEGAEYQILCNLAAEHFNRIAKIVMEYHTTTDPGRVDEQSSELVSLLQERGYQIDSYRSFGGGGFIHAKRAC